MFPESGSKPAKIFISTDGEHYEEIDATCHLTDETQDQAGAVEIPQQVEFSFSIPASQAPALFRWILQYRRDRIVREWLTRKLAQRMN
jgi:hypothetical protein